MKRKWTILGGTGLGLIVVGASIFSSFDAGAAVSQTGSAVRPVSGFNVEILVNGRRLDEYHARGRSYEEAIEGAEYEVRLRNPLPYRVAVALSVDGLNTIDARRTSA